MGRLDDVDLTLSLSNDEEAEQLSERGKRLQELRLRLAGLKGDGKLGRPVCVLLEGWDASGKGGAIRRLVAPLDLRHVRVAQFAAPTPDEKRHHFLSRFFPQLPGWAGMAVFDGSWYGRVLVERVDGFASDAQWKRAYDEIVELERSLAAEGMVVIKLWLHISEEEQLHRFEARRDAPLKSWKLPPDDWDNRRKRPAYVAAVEEMLKRTDHEAAPWELIEAESKRYARVRVMETVIARIEAGMRAAAIEPPSLGK